jgi:glycosyltransferase involved in cell wall biosynthesis
MGGHATPARGRADARFAIVSPNFFPRTCGVGDYSARLGQELMKRGFEASVYSRNPAQAHPGAPEVPVVGADGGGPIAIGRRLAESIMASRPTDLILQYTPQMWAAWRFGSVAIPQLAATARRAGIRVTLVAHELFLDPAKRPDLLVASATQRAQFALLLAQCTKSFVTTESRRRVVTPFSRALGQRPPSILCVGPNALPIWPKVARPSSATIRVGLFSTAAFGKRFDILLDVFERISNEHAGAELVIIGDLGKPDAPHVRSITDAVRQHRVGDRIRLTGKLTLDEVARRIAELDLYLFPMNTGANTRSGTLPVALGAGLPIIAFDGPETDRSIFVDGENIVLVPALTAPAFGDAALALLRDPERMRKIGAGARTLYETHLTWDRITDQLLGELGYAPSIERPSALYGDGTT